MSTALEIKSIREAPAFKAWHRLVKSQAAIVATIAHRGLEFGNLGHQRGGARVVPGLLGVADLL